MMLKELETIKHGLRLNANHEAHQALRDVTNKVMEVLHINQQQAEQIRQLEDKLMFRIEDIYRLENELLSRPPLPLEGEARSRILQELGATGIDEAIHKFRQQAEQIEQLSACIDSVLVVAADYDGYTTVEGFKKLVYRLASIASSRRPEEIQKGYDNES